MPLYEEYQDNRTEEACAHKDNWNHFRCENFCLKLAKRCPLPKELYDIIYMGDVCKRNRRTEGCTEFCAKHPERCIRDHRPGENLVPSFMVPDDSDELPGYLPLLSG